MKNLLKIALTAFALAALCGPVFAQDEAAAPPDEETKADAPAKPAPKKAAAKKKSVKKKKKAPVSEYKFKAAGIPPAYKFDKRANPLIKAKPKPKVSSKKGKTGKKPASKAAEKTTDEVIPKLTPPPDFGEEAPANNQEGGQ